MKNFVFLILPVLATMASCSRELTLTGDELKHEVFYVENDHKPFTGVCRIYYPGTSTVKEEFHYKKGRMEGDFVSYFPDGSIKRKGNYSSGMFSGTMREWDVEGNLILEAHVVNDTLDGQFIRKSSNGNIMESGVYAKNKRVGEWITN